MLSKGLPDIRIITITATITTTTLTITTTITGNAETCLGKGRAPGLGGGTAFALYAKSLNLAVSDGDEGLNWLGRGVLVCISTAWATHPLQAEGLWLV